MSRAPAALPLAAALLAGCGGDRAAARPTAPSAVAPAADAAPVLDEAAEEERLAALDKALADLSPAASACWGAAAADDFRLAGRVALLIDVDAAGAAAAQVHEDTAGDPVLTGCLVAIARGYTWPPPLRGSAVLVPLAFDAPRWQSVIDRRWIPEPAPAAGGARVLLDAASTGNAAASMFEWVVPAGQIAPVSASERAEVWVFLDDPAPASVPRAAALDAVYLPPGTARAPAAPPDRPLRVLVIATPGGDERGSRRAGVLPAAPSKLPAASDRTRPRPTVGAAAAGLVAPRPGIGEVTLLIDPAQVAGARLSAARLAVLPGASIPEHLHDGSTELLYVLDGGGTMTVDGIEVAVGPTSVVQVPPGMKHAFVAGPDGVDALQFHAPPGPEQRFKQK